MVLLAGQQSMESANPPSSQLQPVLSLFKHLPHVGGTRARRRQLLKVRIGRTRNQPREGRLAAPRRSPEDTASHAFAGLYACAKEAPGTNEVVLSDV